MQKKKRQGRNTISKNSGYRLRLEIEVVRQLAAQELTLAVGGFCTGASVHSNVDPGCAGL
jgi:hypothetical protein